MVADRDNRVLTPPELAQALARGIEELHGEQEGLRAGRKSLVEDLVTLTLQAGSLIARMEQREKQMGEVAESLAASLKKLVPLAK